MEREGTGRAVTGSRVTWLKAARGPGWVRAARGLAWVAGGAALLTGGASVLAGCSTSASMVRGVGGTCGITQTAADVAVLIKVTKGTVDCVMAIRVENEYAAMIRAGQVPGNGGGAPVAVSGWICQGYATPEVVSTGDASQCHTASAAIVAVLPAPAPGAGGTVD